MSGILTRFWDYIKEHYVLGIIILILLILNVIKVVVLSIFILAIVIIMYFSYREGADIYSGKKYVVGLGVAERELIKLRKNYPDFAKNYDRYVKEQGIAGGMKTTTFSDWLQIMGKPSNLTEAELLLINKQTPALYEKYKETREATEEFGPWLKRMGKKYGKEKKPLVEIKTEKLITTASQVLEAKKK